MGCDNSIEEEGEEMALDPSNVRTGEFIKIGVQLCGGKL